MLRSVSVAVIACLLSGCSILPGGIQRPLRSLFSSDRPLAIVTFDENRLPIAPGARGVMMGYFPSPTGPLSAADPRDARFTYRVQFRVVSSRGFGRQLEGRGVRQVFFNPDGAHASFADPSSFVHGRLVETDMVKFSGEYVPEEARLRLRVRAYESTIEPVEYDGRPIEALTQETPELVGWWRESVGAWMFSGSPTSF